MQLQYETVKKSQAEEQGRQQAEAGQQAKSEQPQQVDAVGYLHGRSLRTHRCTVYAVVTRSDLQGPKQSVATRIGYRR